MSINYDNWERLVQVVLRREQFRQLALDDSSEPSFSSISSSFIPEQGTPVHNAQSTQLGSSSNTVRETDWGRLLLSDYWNIIFGSVNSALYENATIKELYLSLCDSPILLDGGKKSFHIDKTTGKKCYMIGAREFIIVMEGIPLSWDWTSHTDSRFATVAEFKDSRRLDIRGRIDTKMLSTKTRYAAYLVFKFGEDFRGIGSAKGIIKFVKYDKDGDAKKRAATLHLQPVKPKNGKIATRRSDGWMEVQLGMFYNDQGEDGPVEARLLENNDYIKSGLIVEGIEFRPTTTNAKIGFVSKKYVRTGRNWERLVQIVLRREQFRQLALDDSSEPSFSSISSSFIPKQGTPVHNAQSTQLGSSSNTVRETDWGRLLLSDYWNIIFGSVNSALYENATIKELYLSLCDSPILLDGGKMSFHIDKTTGKKCYMIGARELIIIMEGIPLSWDWKSHTDSRFATVAEFKDSRRLDIRGRIDTKMLSTKTRYAAYLVFKFGEDFRGIGSAKGIIKFVKYDKDGDAKKRAATLHLQPVKPKNGKIATRRSDGWMEVQLGMFYNDQGEDGPVEARLLENNDYIKSGLIVEGIEFRPTTTNAKIGFVSKKYVRTRRNWIFSNMRQIL
ncbi:putative F-box protein PP2-B8 [Forsythia ovata]|uniref:F-box protein PP2-B8 n=1 Tax=Forsythia ovata TaxID=205694 RepID=A0ABD1PI65_9LAMI